MELKRLELLQSFDFLEANGFLLRLLNALDHLLLIRLFGFAVQGLAALRFGFIVVTAEAV